MRLVVAGTPQTAVPSLRALLVKLMDEGSTDAGEARAMQWGAGAVTRLTPPRQNRKYLCAIGSTLAGSQVSNCPSARTW